MSEAQSPQMLEEEAPPSRLVKVIQKIFGAPSSNTEIVATVTQGQSREISGDATISNGALTVPTKEGDQQVTLANLDFVTFFKAPQEQTKVELIAFEKVGRLNSKARYIGRVDVNSPMFTNFQQLAQKWNIGVTNAFHRKNEGKRGP